MRHDTGAMFLNFFTALRAAKVPVSLREYLSLLRRARSGPRRQESGGVLLPVARLPREGRASFRPLRSGLRPHLSRVWRRWGEGIESAEIPDEWLRKLAERYLSEEEKREIEALGLGQAVRDAEEAAGGTEGTPSGRQQMDWHRRHLALWRPRLQSGRHPHRAGKNRNFRAVKVWDKREFKDFDDSVELGVRNMRVALQAASPLCPFGRRRRTRSRRHDP